MATKLCQNLIGRPGSFFARATKPGTFLLSPLLKSPLLGCLGSRARFPDSGQDAETWHFPVESLIKLFTFQTVRGWWLRFALGTKRVPGWAAWHFPWVSVGKWLPKVAKLRYCWAFRISGPPPPRQAAGDSPRRSGVNFSTQNRYFFIARAAPKRAR